MANKIRGEQIKDDSVTGTDIDESTLILDTLRDVDGDTKIQIEESADEDKIRFDTAGVERLVINSDGGIAFGNTSVSGAPASWNFFNFKGGGVRVTANNFYCDNDRGVLWGDSSVSIKGNAAAASESLTVRANYNAYIHVDGVGGSVGIGTVTPDSDLHVNGTTHTDGGVKWKLTDAAADITLTTDHHVIRCVQTAPISVHLPSKTAAANHVFIIKDALGIAGTYVIKVKQNGLDTIDGSTSRYDIDVNYGSLTIMCDGVNGWMII
jgi:hypothetical protein